MQPSAALKIKDALAPQNYTSYAGHTLIRFTNELLFWEEIPFWSLLGIKGLIRKDVHIRTSMYVTVGSQPQE